MSKEDLFIGDTVRFDLHKAKQLLARFEYEFLTSKVDEGGILIQKLKRKYQSKLI